MILMHTKIYNTAK